MVQTSHRIGLWWLFLYGGGPIQSLHREADYFNHQGSWAHPSPEMAHLGEISTRKPDTPGPITYWLVVDLPL